MDARNRTLLGIAVLAIVVAFIFILVLASCTFVSIRGDNNWLSDIGGNVEPGVRLNRRADAQAAPEKKDRRSGP
jgi:hypothetical protein